MTRELFNTARDHDQSATDLINALDADSQNAGYSLAEYLETLGIMAIALSERVTEVREELGE